MSTVVTIDRGPLAAAILAILLGGCAGPGGQSTSSPEPTATLEATAEAMSSPTSAPPLTRTFTSTLHGISVSYPEGWTAQAATAPWTDRTFPLDILAPQADFLYDSSLTDHLFLTIASQPIGDSTPEDWVAEQMASGEGCTTTEPIAVDGANGLIGADDCNVAAVTTAGRGYWIQLYASGDTLSGYDRAWFEEVLATVQLDPKEAVDTPPSASP
jgi:hypothetical protein